MNYLKNENDSYNSCVNPFNPMYKPRSTPIWMQIFGVTCIESYSSCNKINYWCLQESEDLYDDAVDKFYANREKVWKLGTVCFSLFSN